MESNKINVPVQLLNNLCSAVDITKAAISEFAKCIEENIEDERIVKCFDEFVKLSTDYVNALDNLSSSLTVELQWLPFVYHRESDSDLSQSKIKVFPSPQIDVLYADGQTPWSFWLYFKTSPEFESLQTELQNQWQSGNLRKVSELPPVGSFVICNDRNHVFRGIILSTYVDKARVRNVDDTIVKLVKLDNIYSLQGKWSSVHTQTVQCCLTKDESLVKMWNSDLSELFRNTLKEGKLAVSFVEECADCIPAKFLVNLQALGKTSVDLNCWICDKIFPELIKHQDQPESLTLEELSESVIDPYYNEQKDIVPINEDRKEKLFQFGNVPVAAAEANSEGRPWSSQLYMPPAPIMASYFLTQGPPGAPVYQHPVLSSSGAIAAQFTTTTLYESPNLGGNTNVFRLPQHMTTTRSFILKQTDISKTTLNANTPVFEPRKKSGISVTEVTTAPICEKPKAVTTYVKGPIAQAMPVATSTSVSSEKSSDSTGQPEICPMFSKNGYCLLPSCAKTHVRKGSDLPKESPTAKAKSSQNVDLLKGKCSEIEQVTSIVDKGQTNSTSQAPQTSLNPIDSNTDYYEEDSDEDLEEPCISGGYMPKDESRVCPFPSKNGRCWKPLCNKEHEEPNKYKWTTDKQITVEDTFNYLNLPEVGETIELIVTHVVNPFTFYARLPDVYSDIGEGVINIETFRSFHKSLNDPKNIKSYMNLQGVEAGCGEMFIVRALDRYWKRARVLDSCQKSVKVFYVDYGNEETVPEADIRLMEDRFNHLPAQAVFCTLSGLFCDFDDLELRIRGRKFLEGYIKGKVITGKVVNRNIGDNFLDLLVSYKELNINCIMVDKGFCETIRDNSSSSML